MGPSVMMGLTTAGVLVDGAGPRLGDCWALTQGMAAGSLVGRVRSQSGSLWGLGVARPGGSPLVGRAMSQRSWMQGPGVPGAHASPLVRGSFSGQLVVGLGQPGAGADLLLGMVRSPHSWLHDREIPKTGPGLPPRPPPKHTHTVIGHREGSKIALASTSVLVVEQAPQNGCCQHLCPQRKSQLPPDSLLATISQVDLT